MKKTKKRLYDELIRQYLFEQLFENIHSQLLLLDKDLFRQALSRKFIIILVEFICRNSIASIRKYSPTSFMWFIITRWFPIGIYIVTMNLKLHSFVRKKAIYTASITGKKSLSQKIALFFSITLTCICSIKATPPHAIVAPFTSYLK